MCGCVMRKIVKDCVSCFSNSKKCKRPKWKDLGSNGKLIGLYVHIPFCEGKCFYCDFFSVKYDSILADDYINALVKHAEQFRGRKIGSIYLGGGTPSVLSLKQVQKLLQILDNIFDLASLREFTFEVNPESISKEKLYLLKRFGVTRLSIGLQSVENEVLRFLGRLHSFEKFCDVYDSARNEGFDNINIDLVYGLPNQTVKSWVENLERVLLFGSEHLSVYPLSIEKDTFFYKNGVVTDDDVQRSMYDKAVKILADNNYLHYEISNWSKKNKESLHNVSYWRNFEYIGLGSGAAGYLDRIRYKNINDTKEYIKLANNGSGFKIEGTYINEKLYEIESIMLGLRLLSYGVDISCFASARIRTALLECLESNKVLLNQAGRVKLAPEYVFVSNQIITKFME
jgi:oxygen-independent coproporphyrinogen-3 oxidase